MESSGNGEVADGSADNANTSAKQGKNRVPAEENEKATARTRTGNLRFTKPLLCQLSYGGKCFPKN